MDEEGVDRPVGAVKPSDVDKPKDIKADRIRFTRGEKLKTVVFFEKGLRLTDVVKYGFLVFLLLVAISSLDFSFIKPVSGFLARFQTFLTVMAIALGGLTFWLNKEKIDEIEEEENAEAKAEEKRKKEFSRKYPKVNKIPVLRSLVKWMYKEGWWYSVAAILLIIVGFAIRLYKLGYLGLWWDELTTGAFVTRILETGVPLYPSGLGYYWRGVAYHYFVAIFAFLFGNTEFWLRFPSVLFGMGTVILAFLYAKKIDKKSALLVLLFLVFSTYNIEYSRFARFYIMNTFLFMLSIYLVWEGFFNNKLKYKILSLITFFVMMQTVQMGVIFLSLICAWLLNQLIVFLRNPNKNFFRKNISNLLLLAISALILLTDNILDWLIKIEPHYEKAIEVANVTAPPVWEYVAMPKWNLIKFFGENYFSVVFLLLALLVISYFSFKSIKKNSRFDYLSYIGISLIIGIIAYEVGSRGVLGPRMYLFSEALIVMMTIISICYFMKITIGRKFLVTLILIVIILLIGITPNFCERINLNYGDNVTNDPFRTTHVAAYRSDYKTTSIYLKENIREEDILIVVMGSPYYYNQRLPDYTLNQNYRWNTYSYINEERNFILIEDESTIINSAINITGIIDKNPKRKIWLLVNGASINILATTHVRKDFITFLKNNEERVVYRSPDEYSMILLLTN